MAKTDNDRLNDTYTLTTIFRHYDCGCIQRDDGQRLRRCLSHRKPVG